MDNRFMTSTGISLLTCLTLLSLNLFNMTYAAVSSTNSDAKCKNNGVLYKEIIDNDRLTKLTPIDDAVLLSKHYCVGFFLSVKRASFKLDKAAKMASRYYAVGDLLRTDAEKVAFAHLFLQKLSRKKWVLREQISPIKLPLSCQAN